MAKFRKSIKIAPGVKVNLSKSGVSGTFGVKGASVNIGKNGAYLNTGIPGTGIYDREKLGGGAGGTAADETTETQNSAAYTAIGKTGKRVCFIIFLIIAVIAIVSLCRGHPFWAVIQGILAFGFLLFPYMNNLMAQEAQALPKDGEQHG